MLVDALIITHLNYTFAYVDPSTCSNHTTLDAATPVRIFQQVAGLKTSNPNLQIFVSLGGWPFSDNGTATQPVFGNIADMYASQMSYDLHGVWDGTNPIGSKVQGPRSKVQDPRSKIQDPRSKVQGPRSKVTQTRLRSNWPPGCFGESTSRRQRLRSASAFTAGLSHWRIPAAPHQVVHSAAVPNLEFAQEPVVTLQIFEVSI